MSLTPKLLTFAVTMALGGTAIAANPVADQARQSIRQNPAAVHAAASDEFVVRDIIRTQDGVEHVRFDRSHRGLPVIGGDFVVHQRNGKFQSADLSLRSSQRPSLAAAIKADKAMVEAGAVFGGSIDLVESKGLVVYALGNGHPKLAFEIRVKGVHATQGESDMRYFVDARSGKVLDGWNIIHTAAATGTGKTLMVGNVPLNTNSITGGYELVDTTRGGGNTRDGTGKVIDLIYAKAKVMTDADNIWGNNSESMVASEASDAHFGVAATWDFYKTKFGRNGIYNDNVGVKSIVNVMFRGAGPATGGNAAWYGAPYKFMAYGSGDSTWLPVVSVDVAGHEMTHGVTEATSNLAYSNDAGGLNEASSDIMGTMVEYFVNAALDTPDYMIGEEIWRSNPTGKTALRYMFRPGDADGGRSYNCYPAATFAGVDPHYSSGPANHFFYLLAEGAVNPAGFNYTAAQLVCNGDTGVTGIGRDAATAIWYDALTTRFTSGTTYPQARAATLASAAALYGAGSAQYNAVARAWSAVGVN